MSLDTFNKINLILKEGKCAIVSKSKMAKIMDCNPRIVKNI